MVALLSTSQFHDKYYSGGTTEICWRYGTMDLGEELVLTSSSASRLATADIKAARKAYKCQYDKHAVPPNFNW